MRREKEQARQLMQPDNGKKSTCKAMLSKRTLLHIVNTSVMDLSSAQIDTLLITLGLQIPQPINGQNVSKEIKKNVIYQHVIDNPTINGPFGQNLHLDLLQYFVDAFYQTHPDIPSPDLNPFNFDDDPVVEHIPDSELFSRSYPQLANLLRMDGYTVVEKQIVSLLPQEIETANVESELERLLRHFNMNIASGHLEQAIMNYRNGNWAAANAQFRPFFENLMVEIHNRLLPGRVTQDYGLAFGDLSNTQVLNPSFFSAALNEIVSPNMDRPFIPGLWKRLHPNGPHPGLSDEEDCTFRYHICAIFARYALSRLANRFV